MTLKQTFHNIKSDYLFYAKIWKVKLDFVRLLFLLTNPSHVTITFYRIYRFIYLNRLRPLAWFLYQVNLYLTGADILPTADIGEAFYIGHCEGVIISGKIGSGVILLGQAAIGGGFWEGDIGGGPGLPVIGNNVLIGFRAVILGLVTIGDNANIGALTYVTKSVPENMTAIGNPCRILQGKRPQAFEERVLANEIS